MAEKPLMSIAMAVRNERGNIEPTVKGINGLDGNFELIFVEGHSKDGTLEEIERVAGLRWKYPIRFTKQDGIGKKDALLKGFRMAKGDILLMFDLDGEIPPSEIQKFYDAFKKDEGTFFCGNRFVKGKARRIRLLKWLGNLMFSILISTLTGRYIRDTLLGIKGFWRKHFAMMESSGTFNNDYDRFAEFDLLFGASRIGLKIKSIPTRYEHRRYGETKVHIWKTGWQFLKRCILEFRWQLSQPKPTPSHWGVLVLIFIVGLGLRLIHLNYPLFDHASVRSAETFTIAKNFITQNLPIWRPRVDWGGQNGGFVKFEFQLYTYFLSLLMRIFGLSIALARLFTILISLASGWFFYKILMRFFSPAAALFGAAVYLLNPIIIYFGRMVQPDAMMLFFGILSVWFVAREAKPDFWSKFLGAASLALAIMLKPTAGVFLAPFLLLFFGINSWRQLFAGVFSYRILIYALTVSAIALPAWLYYSYIDQVGDIGVLNMREWWISWDSMKAYFYTPLYQKYLLAAGAFFNPIGWLILLAALFFKYSEKDFFIQPFVLGIWAFAVAHSPLWLQGFHEWHFMVGVPAIGLTAAKVFDDWREKNLPAILSPRILVPLYLLFVLPAIYGLFFISNTRQEIIRHNVAIITQYVQEGKITAVTDPGATITNFYSGRIGVYAGFELNQKHMAEIWARGADFILVTRPQKLTKEETNELKKLQKIYSDEEVLLYKLR